MAHILVTCAKRYNGHELWVALGVLKQRGHTFEVVSTETTIRDELTLKPNTIKRTVYEVTSLGEFDGILVVSGNMSDTEAYWDDKHVLSIVATAKMADKPIGAICCSVPTIRHAAKDKRVSFYPLVRSRERLGHAGAILQSVAVSVDGKLVTAEHQMASEMWIEEYCNVLEGKPPIYNLVDSGYMPKGRLRKPIPELERVKKILEDKAGS
jgi:putative intracellular protease/amidase